MPERHLHNHGGKPTLIQFFCEEPDQDFIPNESVWYLYYKSNCKRQAKNIRIHVENFKLSHKDSEVNEKILKLYVMNTRVYLKMYTGKWKWTKAKYMNILALLWTKLWRDKSRPQL